MQFYFSAVTQDVNSCAYARILYPEVLKWLLVKCPLLVWKSQPLPQSSDPIAFLSNEVIDFLKVEYPPGHVPYLCVSL